MCCPCLDRIRPNPLVFVFSVSFFCLVFGLCIAIYDINNYGSGLYLSHSHSYDVLWPQNILLIKALVSIVTVVVVLAFCLVGTDEQTEPTVAKKVWSTTRQTIRRFKKEPSRAPACEIRIVNIDLDAEVAGCSSSSLTGDATPDHCITLNRISEGNESDSFCDQDNEEYNV